MDNTMKKCKNKLIFYDRAQYFLQKAYASFVYSITHDKIDSKFNTNIAPTRGYFPTKKTVCVFRLIYS